MLDWLPEWAQGGAGGALGVGAIVALVKALARRSDASSLMQEAAAFGFKTLSTQVTRLTDRCEELNKQIEDLRDELDGERQQRMHWHQRFQEELSAHTATRQAAEQLKREWEADKARPSVKSERPGPASQRKA